LEQYLKEDGDIEFLVPPEYHGDPINPKGCVLYYQTFGWELLEELKALSFSDAYVAIGWSEEFCYFTQQIMFVAVK
jgi:hypothetical protein